MINENQIVEDHSYIQPGIAMAIAMTVGILGFLATALGTLFYLMLAPWAY